MILVPIVLTPYAFPYYWVVVGVGAFADFPGMRHVRPSDLGLRFLHPTQAESCGGGASGCLPLVGSDGSTCVELDAVRTGYERYSSASACFNRRMPCTTRFASSHVHT